MRRCAAAPAAALALWLPQAHAHLVETGLGPVYDGIAHFALTAEDLLPALAVALLAGLRGVDHARRAIVALPAAWLLGGVAGTFAGLPVALPPWLPLLALGGLIAADFPLPLSATMAIAALVGALLGYANGVAMAQAGLGLRGVFGIVVTAAVVTTLVAAGVAAWQSGWRRIAWRTAGGWIAASGLLLLGWTLR